MYREAKEKGNFSLPSRHGRHLGAVVNGDPAGNTALQRRLAAADVHVDVHIRTIARAGEHWVLKTKFLHRVVDVVDLRRAVGSRGAVEVSARGGGTIHRKTLVVAGTGAGVLAVRAVDEGDVVPDVATGNAVLELGLLTAHKLVRLADLQGRAAAIAGATNSFSVLGASGNVNGARGVALVDAPEPDVVVTAVAHDRVAQSSRKTGLQGGGEEESLNQHV